MTRSGREHDHGVTADYLAFDMLSEPQYLSLAWPYLADTGVEVDAEWAAPAFEAFLWTQQRSG